MIVIGLTGSIGMGKTTVANQLASFGAQICSADALVHLLLLNKKVIHAVDKEFTGAVKQGVVDRKKLGEIVFADPIKRKTLEALLHPLVVAGEELFVEIERKKGTQIAVLEIPLLFETGAEKRCDFTMVTTAPAFVQKQRVMARPNMTEKKFHSIAAIQMPDWEKRTLADIVVQTGLGKAYSYRTVASIVHSLHA